MNTGSRSYGIFLVVFLGMLFGFGPFLTDMYLPAFPKLQEDLGTNASMVQISLSACMLGLALGQAVWGPLSDRHGRRPLALVSLGIFLISCIGCIFSKSIGFLIAMRLLQGIGGSGGIVLSRSIATDLYSGKELAKMMAIIGAVNGIAPVSAPIIGGVLTDTVGWQGIFAVLLLIGIVLTICCFNISESLPVEKRTEGGFRKSIEAFRELLRNRPYVQGILQYGFLHGVFFSYLASSPFIIQNHYGFSATGYSIFFAVNATTVGVASALSMKFRTPAQCTFVASGALLVLSTAIAATLIFGGSVWIYEVCTLLQVFCCGLCFASTPALTLDLGRRHAGAAAALLGVCTYVFGFVITPLVSLGNAMVTTGLIYFVSALMTFYLAGTLRRSKEL